MAREGSRITEMHLILERIEKRQEAEKKRLDVVYDMIGRFTSELENTKSLIDNNGVSTLLIASEGLFIRIL